MKSFLFLVAFCWITLCDSITLEETEYFGSTGMPESNTGVVGYVTVTSNGNQWRFESNGVPDHDTGNFPGINPNSIVAGSNVYNLPKDPVIASSSSCLPGGPIAMAVNGVIMYNPWDREGENAVEGDGAEIFDQCDGHPDNRGTYHYHKMPSSCLFAIVEGEPSPLIGVAFDGFAIYGPNDEDGRRLTSDDLDECHGRVNSDGVYQYHTTSDFPYILGCFKGTPVRVGNGNCFFASDADVGGNINSPDGGDEDGDEEDAPPAVDPGTPTGPGQGRPPRPPRVRPRGGRFGGRPGRGQGGPHGGQRGEGEDQPEQGNEKRPGTTDDISDRPQRHRHHRRHHGTRDRRSVELDEDTTRVKRGRPMLPANLFQRRLPSGYKEWLSDIVFQRS